MAASLKKLLCHVDFPHISSIALFSFNFLSSSNLIGSSAAHPLIQSHWISTVHLLVQSHWTLVDILMPYEFGDVARLTTLCLFLCVRRSIFLFNSFLLSIMFSIVLF